MRVLVAGATGVLGQALLAALNRAGHEPIGIARRPEGLLQIERIGAKSVRGDVLDGDAMRRIVSEIRPDAVVNLASAIPRKLRVNPKDWGPNDRLRTDGTANLLRAAEETGLRLFVQQSVGYICPPQGDCWMTEDAALSSNPFLRAAVRMEEMVRDSPVVTVLLRYAALFSVDSWHTQQSIGVLRRGLLPIVGAGDAYLSAIHVEDAVQAIVRALDNADGARNQVFNVVDDDPARQRDFLTYAARLLKGPPPRQVPPMMAKMVVGSLTVDILGASYRMSNDKIKRMLGFAPAYPSYREWFARIVAEVGDRDFTPSDDLS